MDAAAFTNGRIQTLAATAVSGGPSRQQITIVVAWGLLFWLIAALFIRCAPASLSEGGTPTALLFAATVPIGWPSVWITRRLAAGEWA